MVVIIQCLSKLPFRIFLGFYAKRPIDLYSFTLLCEKMPKKGVLKERQCNFQKIKNQFYTSLWSLEMCQSLGTKVQPGSKTKRNSDNEMVIFLEYTPERF